MASVAARCSVFIATSLDGFIARIDGSIDWLEQANARVPAGEDCGYGEFMSSIDALVMGRHTFELASSFGEWPYGQTPVFVLSNRLSALPNGVPDTVRLAKEAPAALVARLSAQGMHHLYIDGGATIQSFLADALIDDVTITRIPVLIGSGRPLFGPLSSDVRLEHLSTRAFDFGFVQSKYRVVKAPKPWMLPNRRNDRSADTMAPGFAQRFAEEWVAAWNARDLDRILSHYEDDFEMSSPLIARLAGDASGTLRGKPAIRAYWAKALEAAPSLRFELLTVLAGVNSVTVYYKGHRGLAAEVFHFGTSGKVSNAFAHYAERQA